MTLFSNKAIEYVSCEEMDIRPTMFLPYDMPLLKGLSFKENLMIATVCVEVALLDSNDDIPRESEEWVDSFEGSIYDVLLDIHNYGVVLDKRVISFIRGQYSNILDSIPMGTYNVPIGWVKGGLWVC